jgi:hypothetical protein
LELLTQWQTEDATDSLEAIQTAEKDVAEFKAAMNENRIRSGEVLLIREQNRLSRFRPTRSYHPSTAPSRGSRRYTVALPPGSQLASQAWEPMCLKLIQSEEFITAWAPSSPARPTWPGMATLKDRVAACADQPISPDQFRPSVTLGR